MFKNKAATNSYIGFGAGLISWLLPLGIIVTIVAIIFGLVGYYYSVGKNQKYAKFALMAVILGASARLIYAYAHSSHSTINGSWIIVISSLIILSAVYFKRHQK